VRILHVFSAPLSPKRSDASERHKCLDPLHAVGSVAPLYGDSSSLPALREAMLLVTPRLHYRPIATPPQRMPTHSTPCSIVWSLTSLDKKTNHENKTNKKRKSHFPFARTLFPPHSTQTFLYQTHIYCPGALGECTAPYGILSPASFASSQFCRPKRRPQRTTSGCFNSNCPQSSPRPPALITTDPPHTTVSNIALLRQPRMDYLPQGYCWRGWYP
jgi:hypothetical protein